MIRRATPGDATAIARVQSRAWRRAFADIVDPEKLASMSEEAHEPAWRATLEEGGGEPVQRPHDEAPVVRYRRRL